MDGAMVTLCLIAPNSNKWSKEILFYILLQIQKEYPN